MSKKTFQSAPRPRLPSDDAIAAFEQGGAGHDAPNANMAANVVSNIPAKAAREEKPKRLSVDLPLKMHTRFKTACSATGLKMVDEIMSFIERRTEELEAQAGIRR